MPTAPTIPQSLHAELLTRAGSETTAQLVEWLRTDNGINVKADTLRRLVRKLSGAAKPAAVRVRKRGIKTQPTQAKAAKGKPDALDLRIQGHSFRTISRKLNIGLATAYRHVEESLAELRKETSEKATELRELEVQKMDRLEAKLQKGLASADMTERAKVAAVIVKINESRRKLLGLDAPQKIETSGNLYTVVAASPDCPAWDQASRPSAAPAPAAVLPAPAAPAALPAAPQPDPWP